MNDAYRRSAAPTVDTWIQPSLADWRCRWGWHSYRCIGSYTYRVEGHRIHVVDHVDVLVCRRCGKTLRDHW